MLLWATDADLGTIETGFVSELAIVATQTTNSSYEIKYRIDSGSLPSGLTLRHDGAIVGRVPYDATGYYEFVVVARDNLNNQEIYRTFSLEVEATSLNSYTEIYSSPFLNLPKRKEFEQFILNEDIFKPSYMYRYWDPNFGVQTKMKMVIEFGLQQVNLSVYAEAMANNFHRRRFILGTPKIAYARDSSGNVIYETVYLDVIDNLINNSGESVSQAVTSNNVDYYPNTVENMQYRLESIILPDETTIGVKNSLQPRYMLTQESGNYRTLTYLKVVPLCYALPLKGSVIVNKIKKSGFKFNTIDFDIDRLVVENSVDYQNPRFLLFPRQQINNG